MKLSKGQQATLDLMGISSSDYSDEDLKLFFAFTDRGEGDIDNLCVGRPNLAELIVLFKSLSLVYNMWKEDLKIGLLTPQDFYYESEATFKRAKRADLDAWGYERKVWSILKWGRENHKHLDLWRDYEQNHS